MSSSRMVEPDQRFVMITATTSSKSPNIGHVIVRGVREERQLLSHNGILYRLGTSDLRTLSEIERSYGWLDVRGQIVLDIGAHIGGFSSWALRNGARFVIAVEPEPCNNELLRQNVSNSCSLVQAAVVEETEGRFLWYTSRGHSHGMVSTEPRRGRVGFPVRGVKFDELLAAHSPTVIKVDCEGGEYEFLNGQKLPSYVRQVAAELHFGKQAWRRNLGPELVGSFSRWEVICQPVIGEKNWTTLAGWRRAGAAGLDSSA